MGAIFVAGVHGVGKTTCCNAVAESDQVPHYSASALIKAERAEAISQTSKVVADVLGNQDLLVAAVRKLLKESPRALLDGHFTVRTKSCQFERIPEDIFGQLHLDGIVIYQDDPAKINERVTARDRTDYLHIASHQLAEVNHARSVARSLKLSIYVLTAFDTESLRSAISEIWHLR